MTGLEPLNGSPRGEAVSATPEQIAIDEKALEAAATTVVIDHTIAAHRARAIARTAIEAYLSATKDAQSERVRVLESALALASARLDHASFVCSNLDDADLFQEARDKARAALKGEA